MSYLQRVIATKKVYLFYKDLSNSGSSQSWRQMNLHVHEEFLHFFAHPDSYKQVTEDQIHLTDVTLVPELTVRLADINIEGEMQKDTITKIFSQSPFSSDSAYPNHLNRVRERIEERRQKQNQGENQQQNVQQKQKKEKISLIGALLYQSNPTEETVQGKKKKYYKTYVLYFETSEDFLTIYRAIKNGKQWVQYYQFCQFNYLTPDYNFLNWIVEYSNEPNPEKQPFQIDFSYFHENVAPEQFESFKIFTNKFKYIWQAQFIASKELSVAYYNFNLLNQIFSAVNLTGLSLSKCSLDDELFAAILPELKNTFRVLTTLNLSYNLLTDSSLDILVCYITLMEALITLDLSHNLLEGEERRFAELLHSINLLEIDTDDKFSLYMSHNQLKDSIIRAMEQHVIFAFPNVFLYIDISHNKLSSYGLWRLFSCLQKNTTSIIDNKCINDVVVNIFPLPFNPNLLEKCIHYFYKMYMTKKMYEQEKQKEYQNLRKNEILTIGINDHINSLENQAQQQQLNYQKIPALSMQIIRKRYQPLKPLPNKREYIQKVKQICEEIAIIESLNKSIEQYKIFCQQIYDLEFEFPLSKLVPLQSIIWDKLNEAFLIRDHYSISILMECSKYIGLEVSLFQDYFSKIQQSLKFLSRKRDQRINQLDEIKEDDNQYEENDYLNVQQRKERIQMQIENLLNFDQCDETKINSQIDYLVKETVRLDLRGSAIELIFMIKERRDIIIQRQLAGIYE